MEAAISTANLEKITELLKEGSDPSEKGPTGNPLIFSTDDLEIIELFLNYGLDPKITDIYGFTLEDYTDNTLLKEKLATTRNPIIINPPKFIKYRATHKSANRRAKTRKTQAQKLT